MNTKKIEQQVLEFQCICEHENVDTEGESAPCSDGICNTTIACYSYAENGNE